MMFRDNPLRRPLVASYYCVRNIVFDGGWLVRVQSGTHRLPEAVYTIVTEVYGFAA